VWWWGGGQTSADVLMCLAIAIAVKSTIAV